MEKTIGELETWLKSLPGNPELRLSRTGRGWLCQLITQTAVVAVDSEGDLYTGFVSLARFIGTRIGEGRSPFTQPEAKPQIPTGDEESLKVFSRAAVQAWENGDRGWVIDALRALSPLNAAYCTVALVEAMPDTPALSELCGAILDARKADRDNADNGYGWM